MTPQSHRRLPPSKSATTAPSEPSGPSVSNARFRATRDVKGLLALGDRADTADRACEFLLDRHVIYRRTDGNPLHPAVAQLHYPAYWHYDLLAGLTALADAHRLGDARCARALDRLESLRLEAGGWPAHAKWYKVAGTGSNIESIGWGATGAAKSNDWVTLDALRVLTHAGRI